MSRQEVVNDALDDIKHMIKLYQDDPDVYERIRCVLNTVYRRGSIQILEERNEELRRQLKGVSA